jgi:hypothetical protein
VQVEDADAVAVAELATIKGIFSCQEIKLAQHDVHVTQLWTFVSEKLQNIEQGSGDAFGDMVCARLDAAIKAIKDRLDAGNGVCKATSMHAHTRFQTAGERVMTDLHEGCERQSLSAVVRSANSVMRNSPCLQLWCCLQHHFTTTRDLSELW